MENLFNKLNISDSTHKNCSYCNKPFTEESWCKECDPCRIMEGWTSGNSDIDKFIKDTMRKPEIKDDYNYSKESLAGFITGSGVNDKFLEGMQDLMYTRIHSYRFLEWVPFDKFTDIKKIGEGGFSKVYSATWIDGKSYYDAQRNGSYEKRNPMDMEVALKKLNGSQNISDKYLKKLKIHWDLFGPFLLGLTKDPETEEFIMITRLGKGNLRNRILNHSNSNSLRDRLLNKLSWRNRIKYLHEISIILRMIHASGYFHGNLHSGNILYDSHECFISDFGLSGPANEQSSDDEIYGVLPYIAPEVLNGEPYTLSSDIYSFGIVMSELSFGKPPFYNKKHDSNLASAIRSGLRPEFGKGTPEFYKKLACKCMDANPNERPTAEKLFAEILFWHSFTMRDSINSKWYSNKNFGYTGKEIIEAIEKAEEVPRVYKNDQQDPDAIYTSRAFTFSNLK